MAVENGSGWKGSVVMEITCKMCGKRVTYQPYDNPEWTPEDRKVMAVHAARMKPTVCNRCYDAFCAKNTTARSPVDPVEAAGIPGRYRRWDDRLGNGGIVRWLEKHRKGSVLVSGPTAIGKTFAGCRVLSCEIMRGSKAMFIPCGRWFAESLALRQTDAQTYAERVRAVENVELLLLDDLGKEKYTDAAAALLFRIIEHRTSHCLRTWITTNMTGDLFEERLGDYGEPVRRRITEFAVWTEKRRATMEGAER